MASKVKVLFFVYELPPLGGGVANAVDNLFSFFQKNQHLEIDVITSSINNKDEVVKFSNNITLYKVPIGPKNSSSYQQQTIMNMFLYTKNSYLKAQELLINHDYDFAHFFGYPGALQGLLLKFQFKLPYLVSLRGVDVPGYNPRFKYIDIFYKPLVAWIWKNSEKVIVNSSGLLALAKNTNKQIDYHLIPNGVDGDFYKPTKKKFEKFTVTAGGTLFGKKKGLQYLIKAFAQFAQYKNNVELLLIGSGDLEKKLKELVNELEIKNKVKFVGRKDKDWITQNLPKCHVFCLPSINEGMSNATLEALACGLPIIITPVGGADELLEDGKNGFLVPKYDVNQIAKRLNLLYADGNLAEKMTLNSRKKAEEMSWESVSKKYLNCYEVKPR